MPAQMEPPAPACEAGRCPLCGAGNRCAMVPADGAPRGVSPAAPPADCWCMATGIAPGVLERIPAALRGRACVCAQCATGQARG